jgi:acyl-CoA synthetase (AMP-forming)/AMP-acid ligase II
MRTLQNTLLSGGDKPFIIAPSGQWTYTEMHEYVQRVAAVLDELQVDRLACYTADSPALVAIILAAALCDTPLVVLSRDYKVAQIEPVLEDLEVDLLISDASIAIGAGCTQLGLAEFANRVNRAETTRSPPCSSDSEILVLTSGTTGQAKCVRYRWSDLLEQVGIHAKGDGERWLLAYKLNHFAGLQMLAHVLVNLSTLVLAESGKVVDAIEAISNFSVTHVSSTPTFWRFAMAQFFGSQDLPALTQITLGSEPVSQELLQDLASLFPAARLVHIYALTEAGSCVSVNDGLAGLPEAILHRPDTAAVQFRIRSGALEVKTRHGMLDYLKLDAPTPLGDDGWFVTGDLVKVEAQRIYFIGRRSETINVGGVKVHPLEVENLILNVPGVKLARVFGRNNPVVGQIVAVELVLDEGWGAEEVESSVREICLSLSRHSRPRSIDIVDTITTNNYKLVRQGASSE